MPQTIIRGIGFTMVAIATGLAYASPPVLVKDINTTPNGLSSSSFPANLLKHNGKVYFSATTLAEGNELFVSDGTGAQTSLVKDINVGTTGSSPSDLVALDATRFVFAANDGINGRELWISDGTSAGTQLLKNINADAGAGSNPRQLTNIGGAVVLFWAGDGSAGANGTEVWRTDGTGAGTYRLSSIAFDVDSAVPQYPEFVAFAGKVIFPAQDLPGNSELYMTDGTNASSVVLLKEINPITFRGSAPRGLTVLSPTKLLFHASDGVSGDELWVTDGTAQGTSMLKDIQPGSGGSAIGETTVFGGKAYFAANGGPKIGRELYVTDGTAAGTTLLKDIYPGRASSNPRNLIVCNGRLCFSAVDPQKGGELWVSDGTAAGTQSLDSIPGVNGLNPRTLSRIDFQGIGQRLLFQGSDFTSVSGGGSRPWISDGTVGGTGILKDGLFQGNAGFIASGYAALNGFALFSATDGSTVGTELWKSDGTSAGTTLVADIAGGGTKSALSVTNWQWATVGSTLYFSADDESGGVPGNFELWKSDGTAVGTSKVKEIRPGSSGSFPSLMINGAGILYFTANDGVNGARMWRSDGTDAGTFQVEENNSLTLTWGGELAATGTVVLFGANSGSGTILYRTADGTSANTVPVLDGDGISVGSPASLFTVGPDVFMRATGTSGSELYRYRGGIVEQVADIRPGSDSASPGPFVKLGNYLIYSANDGASGVELWRTDLTNDTTTQILDINIGAGNSNPRSMTVAGSLVFFAASDGTSGNELWVTDGTPGGTTRVRDINPGSASGLSATPGITAIGNKVVFAANNGGDGVEPWVSDGTEVGTMMLKNIAPPGTVGSPSGSSLSFSSNTINIINANGTIYFQANDGATTDPSPAHGNELWKTDGTPEGTVLAADIQPGAGRSSPGIFRIGGNNLFFMANDGIRGAELFVFDITP